MMVRDITIPRDELEQFLLPQLLGRVFHVSTHERLEAILEDGAIRVHPPVAPSYDKAYFRNHGCVSLFDLRSITKDQLDDTLKVKYNFLNYHGDRHHPVFFLLRRDALAPIISWSKDLFEKSLGWQLVPYSEAGHPGDLPLTLVDDILRVTIVHPPDPPFIAALKAANRRA
ncbi:MAG: hypothetical protein AUH69_03665 [Actinobacteria bacterium 13_1_40CM_4_65_12]|nr:MAG: hypothetical protein AUH69_03665 [Actinobacteria bacterium 13_1_40CM_4_65_12]